MITELSILMNAKVVMVAMASPMRNNKDLLVNGSILLSR